jgi:hypothetical protein
VDFKAPIFFEMSPLNRVLATAVAVVLFIAVPLGLRQYSRWSAARDHERAMRPIDAKIAAGFKLKSGEVPSNLADLIPLVEKWGWTEADVRARVVERAPVSERLALVPVVSGRRGEIERWFRQRRPTEDLSEEMKHFAALIQAAGEAQSFR